MYIAHTRKDSDITQSVKEHCEGTAALAAGYAVEALKPAVAAAALWHDVGKYPVGFQNYILGKGVRAPHAFYGAQLVRDTYLLKCAGLMMAYIISGHHAGLPDYGGKGDISADPTLCGYLKRETEDYSAYKAELPPVTVDNAALYAYLCKDCASAEDKSEAFAFWTRYAFSCLTDADSLDTEMFCDGRSREALKADFNECLRLVNKRLAGFVCETDLQRARASLQRQAFEKTVTAACIYLMNMPTGSGKTLCSLKFALERAMLSGKSRIIYVIPYNSIIDQTADEFARVLGDSADILRHQSTYVYEDDKSLSEEEKLARSRATENWDAPIIITTAVQFFESVYGNRRSKLRRLHNLQNAVLVFDEAHLMPREYMQPCLKSIAFATRYLGAEAVLLTATMPDYRTLLKRFGVGEMTVVDLIDDRRDFALFGKCRYISLGAISDEALIGRALDMPSCLIVLNSHKAARKLYSLCPAARKYHLSTWMTTRDRKRVIAEVRKALADMRLRYPTLEDVPPEERIVVVSTSLIEAGVDFDFYTVMREMTGLDSILQSGGRCNREGLRSMAEVYVFEREETMGKPERDARVNVTRSLLADYDTIDSPECVAEYYRRVYAAHEDELESHSIVTFAKKIGCYDGEKPFRLPFRSYSDEFRMIDAPTYAVAVPQDDVSRALIARLPYGLQKNELRALQAYTCSVTPRDFASLLDLRKVALSDCGAAYLRNESDYRSDIGILFECNDIID